MAIGGWKSPLPNQWCPIQGIRDLRDFGIHKLNLQHEELLFDLSEQLGKTLDELLGQQVPKLRVYLNTILDCYSRY